MLQLQRDVLKKEKALHRSNAVHMCAALGAPRSL